MRKLRLLEGKVAAMVMGIRLMGNLVTLTRMGRLAMTKTVARTVTSTEMGSTDMGMLGLHVHMASISELGVLL